MAVLTGSRAFERFTGPQIRRFWRTEPEAFARTDRIHLVSSYLASLLAGGHAPIDRGDGAGMNLMDIARGEWAGTALEATAPGLRERLPPIVDSDTVVGRLAPYWTKRYGFPPAAVAAWTGDNPSSLVGLGVVTPGTTAISLGTSDTVFTQMPGLAVDPSGAAHVLGSPAGGWMSLVCFRNGSLARERVRDQYGLDWAGFSAALRTTPPGNGGRLMLPWFEPEITPLVLEPGVPRSGGLVAGDAAANVRAVIEAQMLAMSLHSEWAAAHVTRIHATGGAARNADILQVMADVFAAPVYRMEAGNAACLGAALRAFHADARARGRPVSWEEVVAGFAEPHPDLLVRPEPAATAVYARMRPAYADFEARGLAAPGPGAGPGTRQSGNPAGSGASMPGGPHG
jgi:xylulokinase